MDTKKLRQKILDLAIHGKLVPPVCRQAGKTLTMNPEPPIKGKKCWFTYVIECEDGSFYKGYTDNLLRRYKQHCDGNGAEYTKKHKPKQLYYWEMHYTQENALNREKYLKSGIGREWFKREVIDKPENFEPASVLLERIRAEKERLVKEGKIKKSKTSKTSDTPHYENVPFEVPSSWVWTTLGELFTLQAGKNITAKDISDKEDPKYRYPCYGGNGLRGYVCGYNRNGRFPLIGRQGALCGNINLADGLFYATEHAVVVETYCETDVDWAVHTLAHLNLNQYATSTAQPGLSVSTINEVLIPLPPIEEQKRIVNYLNKWLALIDKIEQEKANLRTTIKQAKSKILNLAIHGKLVSQDENDEPASELLKRINPKSEITCDNGHYGKIPFEQPSSWVWCRLGDVVSIKSGDSISVRNNQDGKYPIYGGNGINGYYCDNNVETGTIIIGRVGFYCGSVHMTESKAWVTDNAFIVCYKNVFNPIYLSYLLRWLQLNKTSNSTAQPVISGKGIYPLLIPIPPITEQQRIVDAIDNINSKLDAIMESL